VPLEPSRRLHRAVDRDLRERTAPAAPGTRMPRSAACMCARCSTCGSTTTSPPCGRSPRRRLRLVRAYKGSHSGEHGDGIVRSEFHPAMFGQRLAGAFEEVKDRFDPHGLFNPGKIVRAPKFDDRELLRYGPHYHADEDRDQARLVGLSGRRPADSRARVEMCNNNGRLPLCRQRGHVPELPGDPRGARRDPRRANTLRLAITGQLGPDAFASDEMAQTMKLCVSCKACRRECPTGVDMARMKIEVQAARAARNGLSLHDRLVGYLPRYAPIAARLAMLPQPAQRHGRAGEALGDVRGVLRRGESCRAGALIRSASRAGAMAHPGYSRGGGARGGAVRRHLQPLFRAGEYRGPPSGCWRPPATGCICRRPRRAAAALLRAHLSVGRAGR